MKMHILKTMRKYIPDVNSRYLLKSSLLFIVYFITAKIGLELYALHNFAAFIWPPSGIALAALILFGYNLWPAVLCAAFLINYTHGAPLSSSIAIAFGNSLEAVVGTYLLRKNIELYRCFERLIDTVGFIMLAGLISTLISAIIGTVSLLAGGIITLSGFTETILTWWMGDALGILIFTPFLMTWLRPTRPWNADKLPLTEIVAFFVVLIGMNFLLFWNPMTRIGSAPLVYLISLPLLWGGLRLGTRGMTISILITSLIAVVSTISGHGLFLDKPLADRILFLQIFIGTLTITFLVFLSIVKERKHAVKKLQDYISTLENAVQEISSADQAKNDFLATLAHELRNPLSPLLSSIELIKIKSFNFSDNKKPNSITTEHGISIENESESENLINIMSTSVKNMARLLDDLLDISRISRKKIILQKEIIDIREVIKQSIDTAKPFINSRRHELRVSIPSRPIWTYVDPLRIEQMIVNLLNNSAKYTDPGGKIALLCKKIGNEIVISITDNGIGIEQNMLSQIFEPFKQVDKESKRFHGGLGIGLALTKKLAELHNGKVTAESEGKSRGSTFTITLPVPENIEWLEEPKQETITHKSVLNDAQSNIEETKIKNEIKIIENYKKTMETKTYKILVADDNIPAAEGLGILLRHKGYIVKTAHNGVEAMNIYKEFSPEIVLLDIGMPEMNGYEVAKSITGDSSQSLTLVALTGYGLEDDKIKAKAAGFHYHLTKPISISDIEEIIMNLQ
jgi:signal transduction histidine kinase/CheY-like chemotaxis protein